MTKKRSREKAIECPPTNNKRVKFKETSSTLKQTSPKVKGILKETTPEINNELTKITNMTKQPLDAADALGLEHSVANLQNGIRFIITTAPTLKELKRDIKYNRITPEALAIHQRSPRIQLAASLKKAYDKGKLEIFDQIMHYDPSKKLTHKSTSIKGLENPDEFAKASNSDNDESSSDSNSGEDSCPPLPEIKDKNIKMTVFTHKSVINKLTHLSKADVLNSHNERYEFLGDSVLNNVVTMILFDKLKDATEGELTVMRAKIVSNHNLSEWSRLYGFPQMLKSEIDYGAEETFSKGRTKIYADVFEAYIGGLISEDPNNLTVIKEWLERLSKPLIDDLLTKQRQPKADMVSIKNAKGELYALIGSASLSPKYVVTKEGDGASDLFKVECRMGDETIGFGEGRSIKEAGSNAALNAANNREMITKYVSLRMKTPRSISLIKPTENDAKEKEEKESEKENDEPASSNKLDVGPVLKVTLGKKLTDLGDFKLPLNIIPQGDVDLDSRKKLNELLPGNLKYKYTELGSGFFEVTLSLDNVDLVRTSGIGKTTPSQVVAMFLLDNIDTFVNKLQQIQHP